MSDDLWDAHYDKIDHEKNVIRPGNVVCHFKRDLIQNPEPLAYLYHVIGKATNTETGKVMIVYQALYGTQKIWCRPESEFISEVDHAKYPEVKQKYRFDETGLNMRNLNAE